MSSEEGFDVPVVLILFKRIDKPLLVLEQIAKVKPKKLYLLSDGGRSPDENIQVEQCRKAIESAIDWDCEVIKRYAENNIGVYENIAGGAKWVFEREECAIFLEDDNLPEASFFYFCQEMLLKYKSDPRVLWVCGTNYLKQCSSVNNESYLFTRCMLPCGWASWSEKFLKNYISNIEILKDKAIRKKIKSSYINKNMYAQDLLNIDYELKYYEKHNRFYSWDYQMSFSIRASGMLGIVPALNQIKNIGVDSFSIHGGSDVNDLMTQRFCNLETYRIKKPIVHPAKIEINHEFERAMEKIITDDRLFTLRGRLSRVVRSVLLVDSDVSIKEYLKSIMFR